MNYLEGISNLPPLVLFLMFLWTLLWKGASLWRSAKQDQRNWFIVLLIINSLGILDIAYLFFFAKKRMKIEELKFWEALSK